MSHASARHSRSCRSALECPCFVFGLSASLRARAMVTCWGTWEHPGLPWYPGLPPSTSHLRVRAMAQIHLTHILRIAAALSKLCHGRIRELSRHRAHPSPSRTPAHPKSLKTASAPVREVIAAVRLRAMGGRASAALCVDWPNGRRPLSAVAHWWMCAATNSRRRQSGIPSRCSLPQTHSP